jgi:hypothetical protein
VGVLLQGIHFSFDLIMGFALSWVAIFCEIFFICAPSFSWAGCLIMSETKMDGSVLVDTSFLILFRAQLLIDHFFSVFISLTLVEVCFIIAILLLSS